MSELRLLPTLPGSQLVSWGRVGDGETVEGAEEREWQRAAVAHGTAPGWKQRSQGVAHGALSMAISSLRTTLPQ